MKKILLENVLVAIAILLLFSDLFLLIKIRHDRVEKERVKGLTVIDKSLLERKFDSDLANYYKPSPNKIIEDYPKWLNQKAIYTINSKGENERYEYKTEKEENTYRIITIGDSHTFGYFVNTKENYPERLEDILIKLNIEGNFCVKKNKIEVINLGVMGYDAKYAIHRFREDGAQYNPDLVIWFIKNDDIDEDVDYMKPVIEKLEVELLEKNPKLLDDPIGRYNVWRQAKKEVTMSISEDVIVNHNLELIDKFIQDFKFPIIFLTYKDDISINKLINPFVESFSHAKLYSLLFFEEIDRLPDDHPSSNGYLLLVNRLSKQLVKDQDWLCKNVNFD